MKILSPNESAKKLTKKNKNLDYLLKKRFNWMKKYINRKKIVIELGSGNGFIKKYLGEKIITSDLKTHQNIDYKFDMNNLKLPKKLKKKVNVFILNHSLHHCKNPLELIRIMKDNLKKNGFILINEPEISFVFKFFLKIFNHERWDLDVSKSNQKNFWLQNNATGRILFKKNFENKFVKQNFHVVKNQLNEFLIFLNSGGNSVNSPHIKLSETNLNLLNKLDDFLIKVSPKIFALNRRVVLKKK